MRTRTATVVFYAVLVLCLLATAPGFCRSSLQQRCLSAARKLDSEMDVGYGGNPSVDITIIRMLRKTPASDRTRVLHKFVRQSKWGTCERFALCYAGAWYGVDRRACRSYLLNCVFWSERGFTHKYGDNSYPYGSMCIWPIYALYEHTYDLEVITAIAGTYSGEHPGEMLDDIFSESLTRHPRGLLQAAHRSLVARSKVLGVLSNRDKITDSDYLKTRRTFLAYIRRISSDSSDPLQIVARNLLHQARSGRWKPPWEYD